MRRQYGVCTKQHKLIHYDETGEWELFDLARDPRELNSVYSNAKYTRAPNLVEAFC